jgi:hypothetical protein
MDQYPHNFPEPLEEDEEEEMTTLDRTLLSKARRLPSEKALTERQLVAINLLWRERVKIRVLLKVFHTSKQTLYNRALRRDENTYIAGVSGKEINDLVDRELERMTPDEAIGKYATEEEIRAINTENERELKRGNVA